jgi:hypothetical protein
MRSCNNMLLGALRWASHCAGVTSTLKTLLCRLPGLKSVVTTHAGGGNLRRLGGCEDILLALDSGLALVDVAHLPGVF